MALVLTNTKTHGKVKLPEGESYEIDFDADGVNAIVYGVQLDGSDFFKTDTDLMTKFIHYVDDEEYMYDIQTGRNGLLSTTMVRNKCGNLKLRIGNTAAESTQNIVVTHRPRDGNTRVFWSFEDVYNTLGLDTYNYASKWVSNSAEKWDSQIKDFYGINAEGGVIENMNFAECARATRKNNLPWVKRCFPYSSVSTAGTLLLLARFGVLAPQQGGLLLSKGKSAALDMLRSLLSVVDNTPITIPLLLNDAWNCQWPRPPVT